MSRVSVKAKFIKNEEKKNEVAICLYDGRIQSTSKAICDAHKKQQQWKREEKKLQFLQTKIFFIYCIVLSAVVFLINMLNHI